MIREQCKAAVLVFLALTVLTGAAYPLIVTLAARSFFPAQAQGSLIYQGGKAIGSSLIGQSFDDPRYLWGRPSATSPGRYDAAWSSGSNLGPTNPSLIESVQGRAKRLRDADPANRLPVPVDLVTSSASGLDPHISLAGAYYQVPRIARARGVPEAVVKKAIDHHTSGRLLGIFGESVAHVLKVNLELEHEGK